MKFISEYRNINTIQKFAKEIAKITTQRWTIMEICGGQTHAILRFGIDQLLPDNITMLHGPGCPVCVTPTEIIDKSIEIASIQNVIFCSFGDMLRVPGSSRDLMTVKALGGDIRVVYSPLESLNIAKDNPGKEVVFFAIGFETTAPINALAIYNANCKRLENFSVLMAHVLIPPAIETILCNDECNVNAFLAPGHVCAVTGYAEYERLSNLYNVPIIVTGFEPIDILQGIYMAVSQLEKGMAGIENQYRRVVNREGNTEAQKLISEVFKVIDRRWRGLGEIANSGLGLNEKYIEFDAERRFKLPDRKIEASTQCISGLILQGIKEPTDCYAFGNECTPEHPLGATMVSNEGTCAAYYQYRKISSPETTG
ncbi:MAG: hydrogenase formation protein HypD [candidate division Zixibacteria bacterium]|nr:hydrogenase formation protein HypD [candidate division Zixibacteria bacterium]